MNQSRRGLLTTLLASPLAWLWRPKARDFADDIIHPRTHGCGRVFDCHGNEWKKLRWVDRRTGKAEQLVCDENGRPQLNYQKNEVLKRVVFVPTPIRWAPNG